MIGPGLLQIDPSLVEALVFINIAVLTGIGGALWKLFGTVTSIKTALHGSNGDQGFIEEACEADEDLAMDLEDVQAHLRLQGHLLNEVAYGAREVADLINEHAEAEVEVDRLEEAHRRARRDRGRWSDEDDE